MTMLILALFMMQNIAVPKVNSSCSFSCQITYAIADGPKHGDGQVCYDPALIRCGQKMTAAPPIADAVSAAPGGHVNVWIKATVPGMYTISITMGGEKKPSGSVPIWIGDHGAAAVNKKARWYWPF